MPMVVCAFSHIMHAILVYVNACDIPVLPLEEIIFLFTHRNSPISLMSGVLASCYGRYTHMAGYPTVKW